MTAEWSHRSLAESLACRSVQSGAFERSNVAEVFQLLKVDSPNQRSSASGDSKTFISGEIVRGGITSIMSNASCSPWRRCLFPGFVRWHAATGVRLSIVVVFKNILMTPHVDAHNCPDSVNYVFQLSDFQGGRVILQDPNGELQLEHQGKVLRGSPLEFRDRQVRFCAKERLH